MDSDFVKELGKLVPLYLGDSYLTPKSEGKNMLKGKDLFKHFKVHLNEASFIYLHISTYILYLDIINMDDSHKNRPFKVRDLWFRINFKYPHTSTSSYNIYYIISCLARYAQRTYVVRTLPNKRFYTRYCSCSCWYEDI